ncbi:negative transcriptional regulator [Hyaloraphidium curvatum]|nr:negative transcriptional regulator [Hyaloraphidium curvatum]
MYVPAHFRIGPHESLLLDVIRRANLATLVTAGIPADSPSVAINATHLPMLLEVDDVPGTEEKKLRLVGHIAKANPQWKVLDYSAGANTAALAIFTPPVDAYISPGYYQTKKETGKVVPTWDYQSVHCSGRLEIVTERDRLLKIVSDLSNHHERKIGSSWKVSDAPTPYIDTMLKAIVGVVLHVEKAEGTNKMSQNRPPADFDGAMEALRLRAEKTDGTVDDEKAGAAARIMQELKEQREQGES